MFERYSHIDGEDLKYAAKVIKNTRTAMQRMNERPFLSVSSAKGVESIPACPGLWPVQGHQPGLGCLSLEPFGLYCLFPFRTGYYGGS
jgi:hypothetical protein